jgi:tetratricopeptide (TPR) repeat protein
MMYRISTLKNIVVIVGCSFGVQVLATPTPAQLYVAGEFARDSGDFRTATRYLAPALAAVPDDAVLRQRVFDASLQSGDIDTALKLAKQIIAVSPSDGQSLLVLTIEAMRLKDWVSARKYADALTAVGVDGFLAPILKSWIAVGSKSADPAQYLVAMQATPAYVPFAAEQKAWLALAQGDFADADQKFVAMLGTTGAEGSIRARLAAVAVAQRAGKIDNAKRALGTEPDRSAHPWILEARNSVAANKQIPVPIETAAGGIAETMRRLALDLSREEGRTPAAGYAWLAARLDPGTPETLLTLADVLTSAQQSKTALTVLEGVSNNSRSQLIFLLAQARALQSGDKIKEAIAVMETATTNFPERQETWGSLGDFYRVQEEYGKSIDAYSKAIALATPATESDWSLYFVRGMGYERVKEWDKAEADLKKALLLKPEQASVLNYLGYSWLERKHNIPEATAMIERAAAQRPGDGAIIDSLGWAYFIKGDLAQAVLRLEDAIAAVPNDPTVNEHLGDAYLATGRDLEAVHRWQAALDAEPDAEQKTRLLKKLDRS